MTARSISVRDGDNEIRRWTASFCVIAALHAVPLLAFLYWKAAEFVPAGAPQSAIMIDMAPAPAAPPAPPTEIPPGPLLQRIELPKQPLLKLIKIPPLARAAVPIPASTDDRRQTDDKTPVEQTTAPPSADTPVATATAPSSSSSATPSNAAPTWQALLLGRLEQFKRYPPDAQSRRQQGVAYLRFTMDRDGKVLTFRIEKSSGYDALDREALALIQRAQPLPKPPPEVVGDHLELVTPIEFFLSERR